MADDKFFIDRKPVGFEPDALIIECKGKRYVDIRESILTPDQMNRLCSWWIQYIAEHPQPEVKGDG